MKTGGIEQFYGGVMGLCAVCILIMQHTRGVQKVLQTNIQKIHKALEFDYI